MTTRRPMSRGVARAGVNYVRGVVEGVNCLFQEIDQEKDVGNDAYIEFISGEEATGCCIAVQIKSGTSYASKNGASYQLRADKDHFEYWAGHILPIAGIVFDPQKRVACWCDITGYLKSNPSTVRTGPYTIKIPASSVFSQETFRDFQDLFLGYHAAYMRDSNLGEAMEWFASFSDRPRCLDGIKALFFNHRNRKAAWFFIISCLPHVSDAYLRKALCIILAHIPGHGDIGVVSRIFRFLLSS